MPSQTSDNGASATAQAQSSKPAQPRKPAQPKQSLAQRATQVKAGKRKPVFVDVEGIPRAPLSDGSVGAVQHELILCADGKSFEHGPWMLTIPKRNTDGSESGTRFPLALIQALADGYRKAGLDLV